jgi:tetratricopeptide (TPR) repeat protein
MREERQYKNLKVLPPDISRDELSDRMLQNLRGLGLPRLAGKGCLYCHVGDLETPRQEWDYASDAKPMKAKGRVMMAMVEAINNKYLDSLEERIDSSLLVTCTTCHAGRTDPRPLPDVLWAAYETDGIDGAIERYHELRERYFGGDAYDLRVHVLPNVALAMADQGAIDDAIALAALNVEVYPEVAYAKQQWIALMLERTIDAKGIDTAFAELTRMEPTLAPDVVTPGLLDSLAWRLNRSEREDQGHALIEANHAKFPGEYRAIESLAFVLFSTDRKQDAFALLEDWLEENPEHARARRLLINLKEE